MTEKTPQEISLIKMRWINDSHDVIFPSDHTSAAQQWCKHNCEPWEWMLEKWVHAYSHVMSFQNPVHAQDFQIHMNKLTEKQT